MSERSVNITLDSGETIVLNQFNANLTGPRVESFKEDTNTAEQAAPRSPEEVYKELGAGAESGWDFSTRWLNGTNLTTIRTTKIVPADLNAFMYRAE